MDETLDCAINLNMDVNRAHEVRGVVSLPHGTGKTVRIAAFVKPDQVKAALQAGADLAGGEDLAQMIKNGEMPFDKVIATPDMMAVVGRVARILGPRGMMPNPKVGSVTQDVGATISNLKKGSIEYRANKQGLVISGLGKLSFSDAQLSENVAAFLQALHEKKGALGTSKSGGKEKKQKLKASGKRGFMLSVHLSSTMGPSIALNPMLLDPSNPRYGKMDQA